MSTLKMNKFKLIFSSGVANSFEWYDYVLFGHFAPLIGKKFFPEDDPSTYLLRAFLVFAVGYLMRPLGGIFFGVIGDTFGRKTALSAAIMCMAIPTAAIGFLPTYEDWGLFSTSLMILIRMLQGLSMGGALTGSISFLTEHTTKKHRGLFGSITMSSICIGILLGSVVSFIIESSLTPEQFDAWGWRVPFVIGILIYFVGLYIKRYTAETPLFEHIKQTGQATLSPLRVVAKYYWFDMIISVMINAAGSVIFYLEAIYLISYLKNNRGFSSSKVEILGIGCYILMMFTTLFAGWLSDIIGRKKIFIINLISIIIVIPICLNLIKNGDFVAVIIAHSVIAFMAAMYIGPEPALQAEFYPTEIRSTALSISYNLATSVFGGTAPYFIELIVRGTGTIVVASYYIILTSVLGLVGLCFYRDRTINNFSSPIENEQ